jgi:hypothetical protein
LKKTDSYRVEEDVRVCKSLRNRVRNQKISRVTELTKIES